MQRPIQLDSCSQGFIVLLSLYSDLYQSTTHLDSLGSIQRILLIQVDTRTYGHHCLSSFLIFWLSEPVASNATPGSRTRDLPIMNPTLYLTAPSQLNIYLPYFRTCLLSSLTQRQGNADDITMTTTTTTNTSTTMLNSLGKINYWLFKNIIFIIINYLYFRSR